MSQNIAYIGDMSTIFAICPHISWYVDAKKKEIAKTRYISTQVSVICPWHIEIFCDMSRKQWYIMISCDISRIYRSWYITRYIDDICDMSIRQSLHHFLHYYCATCTLKISNFKSRAQNFGKNSFLIIFHPKIHWKYSFLLQDGSISVVLIFIRAV